MTDEVTTDPNDPMELLGDTQFKPGAQRRLEAAEARLQEDTPENEARHEAVLAGLSQADRAVAADVDQASALIAEGLKLGLDADELSALRESLTSPEAEAAVDAILSAASRRMSGYQSLMDRRWNELVAGGEVDAEAESPEAESPEAESPEDEPGAQAEASAVDETLYERNPAVADLLNQLSEAGSLELQEAILEAALAAQLAEKDEALADLQAQSDFLALKATSPRGAGLLEQLAQADSIVDQVRIAEEFARGDAAPIPEVDRNNPARALRAGALSSLTADEMTDETADAILEAAGKGSLISSRKAGWG